MSKLYIAVLDEFPDYMTPTLVAHSMLGAHLYFTKCHTDLDRIVDDGPYKYPQYIKWLETSFKKCVVRVNQKEFDKIAALPDVYLGHEKKTLDGRDSCAVVCPYTDNEEIPNVLKIRQIVGTKTMTVKELIEELKKFPPDEEVYYEGGDYADDWRRVHRLSNLNSWGTQGVLME